MIRAAGLGIAVANACEEAKQAAKHITVSNDEDAIARIIEDLDCGKLSI
jgi:hydroxymethylpyrimidine pyrophosphatase-like HAD family hydrolase